MQNKVTHTTNESSTNRAKIRTQRRRELQMARAAGWTPANTRRISCPRHTVRVTKATVKPVTKPTAATTAPISTMAESVTLPSNEELSNVLKRRAMALHKAFPELPHYAIVGLLKHEMNSEWEDSPYYAIMAWKEGRLSTPRIYNIARDLVARRRIRLANRNGALSEIHTRLMTDLKAAGTDFSTLRAFHIAQPRWRLEAVQS